MKKLLILAVLACASFAFAEDAKPAENPMAQWKPKKVTKKDTKGIDALYKTADEAWKKGDLAAAEALHDFPVYMMTDNAAGVVSGGEWTKDQWNQYMKPAFENMPKDAKMSRKVKATFVTETIAFVEENNTMTIGKGKPETWTSASIVILKDGKWMFKGGAEGGWGDMMGEKKTEAAHEGGTKTAQK